MDEYRNMHQNFLFKDDFNTTKKEKSKSGFCNLNGFTGLIKTNMFQ